MVDLIAELKERRQPTDLMQEAAQQPIARIPALQQPTEQSLLDRIRQGGLAGLGAAAARGALSPQVQQAAPGIAGFTRGLGQGLANVPLGLAQIAGAPARQVELPGTQGLAGTVGALLGSAAASAPLFEGGAELLGGAAKALNLPRALPILRGVGGGAAVGTAQDPTDPVTGALVGGALGVPFALAGPIMQRLFGSNAAKNMTENTLNRLSKGLHTAEPGRSLGLNSQEAAQNLKNTYRGVIDEYTNKIAPVIEAHAEAPVDVVNGQYFGKIKDLLKETDPDTRAAHDLFMKEPTIANAHNLQSTLGSDIRSTIPGSRQEANVIRNLSIARDALKSDIDDALLSRDQTGQLGAQYKEASDFYRDHAVPFLEKKGVREMALGKVAAPKNLSTIFSAPEGGTLTVLEKMPQEFKNRILYDVLGRNQRTVNANRFIKAFDALDQKGLARDHLTEDLTDTRDAIEHSAALEKGVVPKIVKGGLIRIPQWLIAGTALRLGLPRFEARGEE